MQNLTNIKDQIINFWISLDISKILFVLDILIVALLIYWIYIFSKRNSRNANNIWVFDTSSSFYLSERLNLVALNYILRGLTPMLVVAIPVVFQPELRSALERLGRGDIVSDFKKLKRSEISQIISEIAEAVKKFSAAKIGALIVITQKTGLKNIVDTGTPINGDVTRELLLTIFHPKTALHDGAVIVKGNKIIAAGCTLPLSEDKFDFHIGTRHRAALGLSEQSDSIIIVVSEEKGSISLANKGILNQGINILKLKEFLEELIQQGRLKKIQ